MKELRPRQLNSGRRKRPNQNYFVFNENDYEQTPSAVKTPKISPDVDEKRFRIVPKMTRGKNEALAEYDELKCKYHIMSKMLLETESTEAVKLKVAKLRVKIKYLSCIMNNNSRLQKK